MENIQTNKNKDLKNTVVGGKNIIFRRGAIFKKILLILILLSLIPVAFSAFLTISTFQGAIDSLEEKINIADLGIIQLKQDILIQIFLILFLLIILVVFASVLVARGITQPLYALVGGVNKVSEGDLDIRFKIKSRDELGQLAHAFNEMIERLREQRDRELLVAHLKDEFISIAAHQLRTPLSSVKWILKMIMDEDLGHVPEKQRQFLEKGYIANERMIFLVNDLLDISRIEEGRFGFEFIRADFNAFVNDMVDSSAEQAKLRSVRIFYKKNDKPLFLVFDPSRLKMAVSNLLDNAIRYTPLGGEIHISVNVSDEEVQLVVRDSGVGIPKKQQERVFSKFFRGDNVIRMQAEGTGLGLYLSKNIVEKHGGRLLFESEENKGSSFFLTIPSKGVLSGLEESS